MTPTHGIAKIVNARSLTGLKPRAERYTVRDAKVTGLELRIHPDGTKVWTLRYRIHGEQRRLKLAEFSRLSLAKARARAQRELRRVMTVSTPKRNAGQLSWPQRTPNVTASRRSAWRTSSGTRSRRSGLGATIKAS